MKGYKQTVLIVVLLAFVQAKCLAQQEKNSLILNVGYYNLNNKIQYLKATTKAKIDGKFQLVPGIHVSFYITDQTAPNLLGKAVTNEAGEAAVAIPATASNEWKKSPKQSFIVVSEATKEYDATTGNADITKARIKIDTTADKQITATLLEQTDSTWVPIAGVDMKITVQRLGGDLDVNETPTYTTDSLGMVNAEFKRDTLPGDEKGNLVLVAKVEESDLFGSLTTEQTVPWGKPTTYVSEFDKKTLFARRGKAPGWLKFMAYTIFLLVWLSLAYLVVQIWKLKKIGTQTT